MLLAQVLIVLGVSGLGMAARVGTAGLAFWLLGILLFYLPLAFVVIRLNRLMPLEGGLYQWAKFGFNEFVGFLVGWNTWLFAMLFLSAIGFSFATAIAYALGPRAAWVAESKPVIAAASCVLVGAIVAVSALGLNVGKWVHNAGSIILLAVFAGLIALPLISRASGVSASAFSLQLAVPSFSLVNLTIFAKLSAYALAGFEYVAIFAGECRDPARTISRSVFIAAPLIAVLNILGTGSVLTFIRPDDVDLINPVAQVFSVGFRGFGFVAYIAPLAILALLARDIAQTSCIFTGGTRLPMVAGWDHLLPEWFTRLHRGRHTPVNSILFVGAISLGVGLASLIGVGQQEAYQLLFSASGIFVVSGYLVLFAIPLVGWRGKGVGFPWWLKLASLSGMLVTLLFIGLSIFPIIEVSSWLSYSAKIIAVVVGTNLTGAAIFLAGQRRRRRQHGATS